MDVRSAVFGILAWLLTYAIHSTVLLGATWCFLRVFQRTTVPWTDRLWKLAVVGGIVTSSLQIGLGLQPFLGRFSLEAPEAKAELASQAEPVVARPLALPGERPRPTRAPRRDRAAHGTTPDEPRPLQTLPLPSEAAEPDTSPILQPPMAGSTAPPPTAAGPPSTPGAWSRLPWKDGLFGLWSALSAVGVLGILLAWNRLLRRLRDRVEVQDPELRRLLRELCGRAGVRSRVRLTVSRRVPGPMTLGFWRPEICIPTRALHELSPAQKETMLAHELGHVLRRDPLWFNVLHAIERLFFFQPLNRLARRRVQDAAEFLCDDLAVRWTNQRLALASCLTEVAGWLIAPRLRELAPGMAHAPARLSTRIERLLEEDPTPHVHERARWWTPTAAGSMAALALCVPGVSATGFERAAQPPPAAVAPELEDASDAPEEPAVAPLGLEIQAELFDHEMSMLDEELRDLRKELDGLELAQRFEQKLAPIEQRMSDLRASHRALHELLQRMSAPDDPAQLSITGP